MRERSITDGWSAGAARGIEIGHIFRAGSKYTIFYADVLGEDGTCVDHGFPTASVCLDLSCRRCRAAPTAPGLRRPSTVAPFSVHLVIANKDAQARAERPRWPPIWMAGGLVLDDRQASPGVRFKMPSCLGMPWIVVVGRGWADGVVELRDRFSGQTPAGC